MLGLERDASALSTINVIIVSWAIGGQGQSSGSLLLPLPTLPPAKRRCKAGEGAFLPTLGVALHAPSTKAGDFIPFLSLALGCFLFLSCPGKNTRREIKAKRAKLAVTGEHRV